MGNERKGKAIKIKSWIEPVFTVRLAPRFQQRIENPIGSVSVPQWRDS